MLLVTARAGKKNAYFARLCFARELNVNFSFATVALSLNICLDNTGWTDFYWRE